MSLIEEQNRRLADLEWARSSVRPRRSPSPTPNKRGESPGPSRSRYPWHSISVRSPCYHRRSPRRRSPRQSPPRRPPPRHNRRSWSPSSSEHSLDAQNDRYAYGPFTRRICEAPIPSGLKKPPQMDSYDETTYPDEHIENIEAFSHIDRCRAL